MCHFADVRIYFYGNYGKKSKGAKNTFLVSNIHLKKPISLDYDHNLVRGINFTTIYPYA